MDEQCAFYNNMRFQNGGGDSSHMLGLDGQPSMAAHVSAAGHYGFQPVQPGCGQYDHNKENAVHHQQAFNNGFSNGFYNAVNNGMAMQTGGSGDAWAGAGMSAGSSGIGPVGNSLGDRKRGRDEVVFQEIKRRRLAEPEAMAVSEPVAPPRPTGHSTFVADAATSRCLMRHMI